MLKVFANMSDWQSSDALVEEYGQLLLNSHMSWMGTAYILQVGDEGLEDMFMNTQLATDAFWMAINQL